ncbi:thiamine phosphate synthase [Henriciella sp.]|uniref:thiamine phosphate synthase n=1 Tax=Henriciella sp. TaxID=1968823 RepID=UPI00260A9127|nr:thiamine phosphate synthase [Henriciella sp.]
MAPMKHEGASDRKFRNAVRLAHRHVSNGLPPGLFVTDPSRTSDILETVHALPDGIGVLFRHFGNPDQLTLAPDLGLLCRRQGRPLIVSADPELCAQIRASGVHWPARMTESKPVNLRTDQLNTMSVHAIRDVRRAQTLHMDAVLISPVFASDSPSAGAPLGLPRLTSYARRAGMNVYALGGVTANNAERVARIAGFASVSGLEKVYGPRT